MGTKLPPLQDVERLSGSIVRIMGGNSNKFTLQGTNTYLLGTDPSSLILIDTAQGFAQWRKNLTSHLSSLPSPTKISTCLLTHWHLDHVLGVSDLLSICPDTKVYKGLGNSLDPDEGLKGISIKEIKDGDCFSDGAGLEVQAVHSPGHTEDHMCLVITASKYPDEVGCIFTGDNVLGHGTAVFEDLGTYLKSLNIMKERVEHEMAAREKDQDSTSKIVKAYPAHGVVISDAKAKIEEYINHRKMREDEALNVLRYGVVKKPDNAGREAPKSNKEWASMDMVKIIYKDVPEHLHVPAEGGLLQVLRKLKREGRVVQTEKGWSIAEQATL